jgi:antitoxin (DNA-binding transcriptional repressor) of toxin-antitoxin stability system
MKTIAIAELKARLCAELKGVSAGESLMVLDHRRPVALISPLPAALEYARRRKGAYAYQKLSPLIAGDPLAYLEEERGDR